MSENRDRRRRGRRKVHYEEVLPSTDLPPLVQGDLRCFLIVDIGKIVWSSTATAQVPPASPAYVRLRWWGESSEGTLFKPASSKSDRVVKSRCRFGVRSGAKQMSAYFVDMGSIILEVLTSPKSIPLGRIQIPKVANLSSQNPIRDFFPIISPSSRKIGELHINIRFRSLEGAYDLSTDTGTDTSMSSRSRPPSEVGHRSRSRGSSVGSRSNMGSARSRSSSTGSRKGSRGRKSKPRSKGRGRSRSTESNGSSVSSKRSRARKKASTVDSSTPRGIDDLLQRNGQDLYRREDQYTEEKPPRTQSKEETKKQDKVSPAGQDAISALLKRGNKLREDIMKSQLDSAPTSARMEREPTTVTLHDEPLKQIAEPEIPKNDPIFPETTSNRQIIPPVLPRTISPVKEQKQDLDMRYVDLVFGSQEFKGHPSFISGFESPPPGSPLSSMISEFEDNPLYDDHLLQQLFYNNGHSSISSREIERVNEKLRELQLSRQKEKTQSEEKPRSRSPMKNGSSNDRRLQSLASRIPGMTVQKLLLLQRVYLARVVIESLNMAEDFTRQRTRPGKGRGRGSKPPVPSPSGNRRQGTYFVEFRFPQGNDVQREHPSSMTTTHDVTRVASRRQLNQDGTSIAFDECCEFPVKFGEVALFKWTKNNLEFAVHCRKPNDKKANPVGVATVPLREVMESEDLTMTSDINIFDNHKRCGTLKVSIELVPEVVEEDDMSPRQQMTSHLDDNEEMKQDQIESQTIEASTTREVPTQHVTVQPVHGSSIALSPSSSILYMMLMVQEGIDIPGMTVISPTHGVSTHPPNVSLVCRTLTSGESEKTPIIWGETNPKFDFVQISPLKLDPALLSRMQNNFVIVEVWTKVTSTQPHSDKLLGLVKLPTHHFYQSLRDEEILSVVLKSQHPLISVDEPVPIVDVFTGQERGRLQVTIALGTQTQIATLKETKSTLQGKKSKKQHLEAEKPDESERKATGPVEHSFEITIVKIDGFKPQDDQVWGETDCFVQYQFPKQKTSGDSDSEGVKEQSSAEDDASQMNLASMQNYRSDAALCVPDPVFNDARRHVFRPPPSVPVQRILLSSCYEDGLSGGIPFELWSRYYHPNVRDQLLAKGLLPVAKIGALVTMTSNKVSEQTFHVPLDFVDLEQSHDQSAGRLEVRIKYQASGTTLESMQPPVQFKKPVILRVGLLRACGLKAAALMSCRHSNDDLMKYHADVGVNTYVRMKPSFLPDEDCRTSRIVAQSFAPEYQHHVELACPLVSYHGDITPISLAELLVSGEMEFEVWHRPTEKESSSQSQDTLLATVAIPMRSLLRKTTGLQSWFPLKPPEKVCRHGDASATVGALEISIGFTHSQDLDLILKAGRATGWSLPHFESRLLSNNDFSVGDITKTDQVTFSVTVTNAWLPKHEILLHGRTSIDKNANVYLRYKFYDHDSVTSSLAPLAAKQPHSIDSRFENLTSARIAHKKSFVCKRSRPLTWFLLEEPLEIQIWLTHSKVSKKSRPLDSDKLLGSCYLDMGMLADLSRDQHISGSFDLFKAGNDDLGGGKVRVYLSMKPGVFSDPIPDPPSGMMHVQKSGSDDEDERVMTQEVQKTSQNTRNEALFPAVVTVERAMHLPLLGDLEAGIQSAPNCFVSYEVVDESVTVHDDVAELPMVTITTSIENATSRPVWNEGKEVCIPRHLLTGTHGALLLKVWHRDTIYIQQAGKLDSDAACRGTELMATDRMLGFATVDLSVLRAGFRDLNGWYNILDIHGQCQGQLKVAVTPIKDPNATSSFPTAVEPNLTAKPHEELVMAPKGVNFLQQTPINIPVQTPSGSMYFPGLLSSAQTVRTTCKMTQSEKEDFKHFHDNTRNILPQFPQMPDFSHPSTSLLRYSSSDRQQACLVNTLQKQIQELEDIKKRFQQRRAQGFTPNLHGDQTQKVQDHSPLLHSAYEVDSYKPPQSSHKEQCDSRKVVESHHEIHLNEIPKTLKSKSSMEESLTSSSSEEIVSEDVTPQTPRVTVLNLRPNRTASFDALPDLEIVRNDSHSNFQESKGKSSISSHSASEILRKTEPPNPQQPNSIHLSLYEKPKRHEFNEGALSDNEATSDVEFVQPRNLNEDTSDDFQTHQNVQHEISQDKNLEHIDSKPPHFYHSNDGPHPPAISTLTPAAIPVTPGRSEGQSVLEDTSLWMSGSTLRVSGFSSDDECESGQSSKVTERSDARGQQIEQTADHMSEVNLDNQGHEPSMEASVKSHQTDSSSDSEDTNDTSKNSAEENIIGDKEKKSSDTWDEEDMRKLAETDQNFSEEQLKISHQSSEFKNEQESEQSGFQDETGSAGGTDEESSLEVKNHTGGESSKVKNGEIDSEFKVNGLGSETEAVHPSGKPRPTCHEVPTAEANENKKPTQPKSLMQERPVLTKKTQGSSFPNFFPPAHNLEASMRALQEATEKHKHKLLKKREDSMQEDHTHSKSPPPATDENHHPRAKKLPRKPPNVSDERTKRLARIFGTKFS